MADILAGILYAVGRRSLSDASMLPSMGLNFGERMEATILESPGVLRGVWTLEGVHWQTGESVLHHTIGWLPIYNSLFAATEIGPGYT